MIFIDEIDGLGKRSGGSSSGETENNRIINTLLVELEGGHEGEWSFEPTPDVRKAAPNMFLLYPHELSSCTTDAKVASK